MVITNGIVYTMEGSQVFDPGYAVSYTHLVSICFIVVNTLTDILYTLVDPRIKLK